MGASPDSFLQRIDGVSDGEPFFAEDGNRLYFNSSRPNPEQGNDRKENIWYVDRTPSGWGEPKPVSQIINRMSMHWQFSVDKRGTSISHQITRWSRDAGYIYLLPQDGEYETTENLGADINSAENEMTPFISPEGDFLIYCRGGPTCVSFSANRTVNGAESKSMGSPVCQVLSCVPC
jgi:Tol biopolymer transport system component